MVRSFSREVRSFSPEVRSFPREVRSFPREVRSFPREENWQGKAFLVFNSSFIWFKLKGKIIITIS